MVYEMPAVSDQTARFFPSKLPSSNGLLVSTLCVNTHCSRDDTFELRQATLVLKNSNRLLLCSGSQVAFENGNTRGAYLNLKRKDERLLFDLEARTQQEPLKTRKRAQNTSLCEIVSATMR